MPLTEDLIAGLRKLRRNYRTMATMIDNMRVYIGALGDRYETAARLAPMFVIGARKLANEADAILKAETYTPDQLRSLHEQALTLEIQHEEIFGPS